MTGPSINLGALLDRPIFHWFGAGQLSVERLRVFAEQYYLLSEGFRDFLAIALTKIPDELGRASLTSNLWDEYGRGDANRFHRVLLLRFVHACGLENPDSFTPLCTTRIYIGGMRELCASSDAGEVLGAIGPGCEDVTTAEYKLIYSGLRRSEFFQMSDLEFFIDHIGHDHLHSDGISDAIARWSERSGEASVRGGMEQSLMLEMIFWDGLWEAMEQLG